MRGSILLLGLSAIAVLGQTYTDTISTTTTVTIISCAPKATACKETTITKEVTLSTTFCETTPAGSMVSTSVASHSTTLAGPIATESQGTAATSGFFPPPALASALSSPVTTVPVVIGTEVVLTLSVATLSTSEVPSTVSISIPEIPSNVTSKTAPTGTPQTVSAQAPYTIDVPSTLLTAAGIYSTASSNLSSVAHTMSSSAALSTTTSHAPSSITASASVSATSALNTAGHAVVPGTCLALLALGAYILG